MTDVCLVTVPYHWVQRPSIALSLLCAGLKRDGISAEVVYSNFRFARSIGIDLYWFVGVYGQSDLMGDWIFSGKAFPEFEPDHDEYLRRTRRALRSQCTPEMWELYLKGKTFNDLFHDLRRSASDFIDETAEEILSKNPRIVGCSSTFQEHCASLALLRRIRELAPDVVTLMGGSNCEGTMGKVTHQSFHWIDYIVSGEADTLLPGLCRNMIEQGRDIPIETLPPGVWAPGHREMDSTEIKPGHALVNDMSIVPVPDYDDYIEALENAPYRDFIPARAGNGIRARLLVGRKAPLHFLRFERTFHGLPFKTTGTGL